MKTMFKFNKWIDKIEKYILEVWIFRLWLIVGVTAIILYFFRLFDLITVIKIVSALIIALLPIYVNATKKKQDVRIMAFTSQYLLEEDKSNASNRSTGYKELWHIKTATHECNINLFGYISQNTLYARQIAGWSNISKSNLSAVEFIM